MSDTPLTDAVENPHTKSYASLAEMLSDVLASRVVGSLILAKGDLNEYDQILTGMITLLRKDYDAKLSAAPTERVSEEARELRELLLFAQKRLEECIQIEGQNSPDEPGGYKTQWDYDTAQLCAAIDAALAVERKEWKKGGTRSS